MSVSAIEYLRHILDEVEYLVNRTQGLTQPAFSEDETLKRAFVRSIEIIGEATKKIPNNFKRKYPDIEWRAMAGMRDKLIHDYLGVDYDLVWDVASNRIPMLGQELKQIIRNEERQC